MAAPSHSPARFADLWPRGKRARPLYAMLLAAWLLSGFSILSGILEKYDLAAQDWVFKSRKVENDTNITIVAYGDNTLNASPSSGIANFVAAVEYIERQKPKVLALDFASLDPSLFRDDTAEAFTGLLETYGNIVFGLAFTVPRDGSGAMRLPESLAEKQGWISRDPDLAARGRFKADDWIPPAVPGFSHAAAFAHLVLESGPDGLFRRAPAWVEVGGRPLVSMGLACAIGYLGTDFGDVSLRRDGLYLGNRRMPLDVAGCFHFRTQPRYSKGPLILYMEDVLKNMDPELAPDAGLFKGKIVLLGDMSLRTGRHVPVPGNGYYPSLLIHAHTARSVLQGDFLIPAPPLLPWLFLLVPCIGCLLALRLEGGPRFVLALGTIWLVTTGAAAAAVVIGGILLPLADIGFWTLAFLAVAGAWAIVQARMRMSEERDALLLALKDKELYAELGAISQIVAHDMLTPIGLIGMAIADIEAAWPADGNGSDSLDSIRKQLKRIQETCDGMLSPSKRRGSTRERIEMKRLVDGVLDMFGPRLKQGGVQAMNKLPSAIVVLGYEHQLFRLFSNLIKNAIEAMPAGGKILVTLDDSSAETVAINVKDTGCGIPEENLGRIFETYFTDGKPGGTGLGLASARQFMNNHLGTIECRSREGEGTEFILRFPKGEAA